LEPLSILSEQLPKVSICLLTYKRAHVLPRTIESLLSQSHSDFELIINDDRSPDDTEAVCRVYERRDPRVRYFKNPVNLRYAGNQNAALMRADSDYVAIVHDGDGYRGDMIEKWTRALVHHPSAALVFNELNELDEGGRVVRAKRHPYGPLVPGLELFDEMIRHPSSPIFGIVMVRKSCVLSAGPFDPRLPVLADVDMWLRLLLRYDAAYIAEPLVSTAPREVGHHNHPTNWRIRGEHELISVLNSRRRYPDDARKTTKLRRKIAPMHWYLRVWALLYCLRHAQWRATVEGLDFIARRLDFAADDPPDSVIDWAGAAQLLQQAQ
jgi:glycosyltransferase involved in cell wall biosynthesis